MNAEANQIGSETPTFYLNLDTKANKQVRSPIKNIPEKIFYGETTNSIEVTTMQDT
jgi:hypothetical protein